MISVAYKSTDQTRPGFARFPMVSLGILGFRNTLVYTWEKYCDTVLGVDCTLYSILEAMPRVL